MRLNNSKRNKNDKRPTRNDFLKDVVGALKDRRIELGLTQEQVDYVMGNSDRLCSKWECGLSTPTSFNLYCWAESLKSDLTLISKKIDAD